MVDLLAVGMLVQSRASVEKHSESPWLRNAVLLQEGTIAFEPLTACYWPPEEVKFILVGTPPAAVVSMVARPAWYKIGRILDVTWLLIHEVAAGLFWFLVGRRLDRRGVRVPKVLLAYLAGRLVLAACGMRDAAGLEMLFWLGYTPWVVVRRLAREDGVANTGPVVLK